MKLDGEQISLISKIHALLVLGKLIAEFDDTALVEEFFLLGRLVPLIDQVDANAGIEESEFAEAGGEVVEIEIDTCGENGGVGEERNLCAGLRLVFQLANHLEEQLSAANCSKDKLREEHMREKEVLA